MIRDRETLDGLLGALQLFVRDRLIPLEDEVAETDEIPESVVRDIRDMGLFGLTISEAYGCLALTMEEEVLAVFEFGRASRRFARAWAQTLESDRRRSC
jgi:acyl-CoA dehydrogenase